MILSKVRFCENPSDDNHWEIDDLCFGMFNLIVGLNATGKTRLVNIISNFAKIMAKKKKLRLNDTNWELTFQKENTKLVYKLHYYKSEVKYEEIKEGKRILLKREFDKGQIYSVVKKKRQTIHPPKDELTLHVRRDVKEFPFLEDLFGWAESLRGYQFTSARPDYITIHETNNMEGMALEGLENIPILLQKLLEDGDIYSDIVNDIRLIGYNVISIDVKQQAIAGLPKPVPVTFVKEDGLDCTTSQLNMSQGMYRAISIIILINYLIKENKACTIVIDDVGEGLDYDRSSRLTGILQKRVIGTKIQLIITSNDRFLINTVDLEHINFLKRDGHVVTAMNKENSKKIYEEFRYTGLNNFDLFITNQDDSDEGKS